jgi:hypothetical protein
MAKIASGSKILTFASTVNTNEKKSASLNANTEYHTTDDLRETVLGTPDEILYKEITVTPPEVESMGSSPIVLLATPSDPLQYYEYKIIIEKSPTGIIVPADVNYIAVIGEWSYSGSLLDAYSTAIIPSNKRSVLMIASSSNPTIGAAGGSEVFSYRRTEGEDIVLTTYNGQGLTGTTATLLVKIWYTVRTFGSEL